MSKWLILYVMSLFGHFQFYNQISTQQQKLKDECNSLVNLHCNCSPLFWHFLLSGKKGPPLLQNGTDSNTTLLDKRHGNPAYEIQIEPINLFTVGLHLLFPHVIILKAITSKNSIICRFQVSISFSCSKVNCPFCLSLHHFMSLSYSSLLIFSFTFIVSNFVLLDMILRWFNSLKPILSPSYKMKVINKLSACLFKKWEHFKIEENNWWGVTVRCQNLDEWMQISQYMEKEICR